MNALYHRLHAQLQEQLTLLPDKPGESAETNLRVLWFLAAGQVVSALAVGGRELPPLADDRQRTLQQLVARRLAGEPLAHITGRCHFMGLELLSGPQALIPRVESELLAGACIELLQRTRADQPAQVIDVCTGSGAVALAIAQHVPGVTVVGADISHEAVLLARRNAAHTGLDAVSFRCGDLLQPLAREYRHGVDLITCVPPYILSSKVPHMAHEISAHEPVLAFDGGPLGVTLLLRLLEEAPPLLRRGGWLALEVGLGQGPALARRLARDSHYDEVQPLTNADNQVRALLARRA